MNKYSGSWPVSTHSQLQRLLLYYIHSWRENPLYHSDWPCYSNAGSTSIAAAPDLELRADAGRFLLLVEVEQGLGDAVRQRQVAEVLQ